MPRIYIRILQLSFLSSPSMVARSTGRRTVCNVKCHFEFGMRRQELRRPNTICLLEKVLENGPQRQRPHKTRDSCFIAQAQHIKTVSIYNSGQPQGMHWLSTNTHPSVVRCVGPRHWILHRFVWESRRIPPFSEVGDVGLCHYTCTRTGSP